MTVHIPTAAVWSLVTASILATAWVLWMMARIIASERRERRIRRR